MSLERGRARLTTEAITATLTLPPFSILADTTNADATITVVSGGDYTDTASLKTGLAVAGTGVSGTVSSITNSNVFELSSTATASGTNVELTVTPTNATVTGRVVNPNIQKEWALALTDTNEEGAPDLKRWNGKKLTGSVEIEINRSSPVFPRQGSLLILSGFDDIDLNKKYTVTSVGNTYPKGNFVAITCNVEWDLLVEGAL